ncbi:NUDIX hydrolase [bacterium SCSIO 12696]|nr:NUDIX hydrolase [bacterium SCSIO 12696]
MATTPVPAKPAASVIFLRDSMEGVELLVARRNPQLRMAGNFWVFPGGALEKADWDQAQAVNPDDELLPYRIAAVRETMEEVGLAIEAASLQYIAHWVAPDNMAVRFDTRFFVVQTPADQKAKVDGSELVELRWLSPEEFVTKGKQGDYLMMLPTLANALRLVGFATVTELLAEFAVQTIEPIKPELSFGNGKAVAKVPAELGLGLTEWAFPYPVKPR